MLQTLSILIQNIRSETAIFYLFSNNFINELITLRFDFEDDEVLGYFVNMLKAISLKLTQTTVQVRPPLLLPARHATDLMAMPLTCDSRTLMPLGGPWYYICTVSRPAHDSADLYCAAARDLR